MDQYRYCCTLSFECLLVAGKFNHMGHQKSHKSGINGKGKM